MTAPPASTAGARRWFALVVMCLSLLVIGLDATILTVALPTLSQELDSSTSQLQWVFDSYILVFAALLLPAGLLGDRFGRRALLLLGFFIFGVASAWAAYASNAENLIAARALMGVGAALIMPLTLAMLPTLFSREERSKALSIWSVGSGIGLPLGPILGGWLLEHYSWGSIFLINVPVLALAIVAGFVLLPESRDPAKPKLDLVGTVLVTVGLIALVYGIIEAPRAGWQDLETVLPLAAGVVLLVGFAFWEAYTSHPMLHRDFFRTPHFIVPTVTLALIFLALLGTLFVMPPYLQYVLGNSPFGTGVRLLPLVGGLLLGAVPSDTLTAKLGAKTVIASGTAVLAGTLFAYSGIGADSGYGLTAAALVGIGVGMGLTLPPSVDMVMDTLDESKIAVGMALNNAFRQVGSALGVAVAGTVLHSTFVREIDPVLSMVPPELHETARDATSAIAAASAFKDQGAAGQQLHEVVSAAYVTSMSHAVLAGGITCAVALVVALVFLPSKKRTAHVWEKKPTTSEPLSATDQ